MSEKLKNPKGSLDVDISDLDSDGIPYGGRRRLFEPLITS